MKMLHEHASPQAVAFGRAYIWALWLAAIAIDPFTDLSHLPLTAFQPTGCLRWLPELLPWLMSAPGLLLLKAALLLATAAALVIRPRSAASLVACGLLTVYQCVLRGYGHMNHAEILLLYAAYAATYFDWCEGLFASREKQRRSTSQAALLWAIPLAICLSYAFTGLHRLAIGGGELFLSGSMSSWRRYAEISSRAFHFPIGRWLEGPVPMMFLEWGLPLVTLFEIAAPAALVSRRFRALFLAVMIPFHLGVLLVMGILFWQTLALYVFFFDLSAILRRLPATPLVGSRRTAGCPPPG